MILEDHVEITGYSGNAKTVVIPATYAGLPVTSINNQAFYDCYTLTNISIPDGVTSIPYSAFYNCHSLASISIPDGVTFIGVNAFYGCESLTSISIPDGVTSIEWGTFRDCFNLTSISILGNVTSIGNYAFAGCNNLTSIYFEGDAPEFADSVFRDVIANAYFPSGNRTWTVLKGYGGNITWISYIPPFYDVLASSFYADPVAWALENNITNGATETTFNPNGQCLRAHVVTFLHRAAESPAPTSSDNPFTDVNVSDFFYEPVLWTVENDITNGISATAFGSYTNCNRAAVLTFLWRAAGSPEPVMTEHPFTDVPAGAFYEKAVLWAIENGITNGISATEFGPTSPCNRAQVVTFLYRACN